MDMLEFNRGVIEEFRANDGVVSGPFEGMPMILVTMTGAKSGRELISPLVYSRDGDDIVIIALEGRRAGASELVPQPGREPRCHRRGRHRVVGRRRRPDRGR